MVRPLQPGRNVGSGPFEVSQVASFGTFTNVPDVGDIRFADNSDCVLLDFLRSICRYFVFFFSL